MESRFKFTRARIEGLPLPDAGKRATYHDTDTPGLQLRVTSNGVKTFCVFRRVKNGKPERITLERFSNNTSIDKVRVEAKQKLADLAKGVSHTGARRLAKAELTLGELLVEFLKHKRNKRGTYLSEKTKLNYRSDFNRHLGKLANRKLSAIHDREIAAIHTQIGKTAPYAANRVLALVSSMYGYAIKQRLFGGTNPASGIQKFPEDHRERFVQPDEMPRFFAALAEEQNTDFRDAFLLALLTGARRSNVLAMRWEQVNLERAEWHIPKTKAGTSLTVPLIPEAVEILINRQGAARDRPGNLPAWVFPSSSKDGHLVETKTAWQRILKRAGIENLRLHDLRHTMGSALAATGANIAMTMQALGHKTQSASLIYQKIHRDPVRQALAKAGASILQQAGITQKADVVKIADAKNGKE